MRILLAGAATALFSLTAATPAFAQYGGSPQQQVDGAPGQAVQAPDQDDDDDQAVAPDDDQAYAAQPDDNAYGKPGADDDQDGAYVDQGDASADQGDADNDVDQGDADTDVDQGDVDADDQGDVDEDSDDTNQPGDGGVAGGGYAQTQTPTQTWQGEDGRTYCRRSDGTTGLVVGGGAGALVGRGIDGGRHRAGGTIIGAIAGAVIGSAVERSANRQRCG